MAYRLQLALAVVFATLILVPPSTAGLPDRNAPVLTLPAESTTEATSDQGSVVTFTATATDWRGRDLPVQCVPPSGFLFPIGRTTVTCIATDRRGRITVGRFEVSVVPAAPPAAPPPAPPPPPPVSPVVEAPAAADVTAPPDVTGVRARVGDHAMTLTWKPAAAPDVAEYLVTRWSVRKPAETVVYRGLKTTVTDRGLANGREYRWVVSAIDTSGNQAAGVAIVAAPKAIFLARPHDGARTKAPVTLRWVRVENASYYNVQLFRETRRGAQRRKAVSKILSVWPKRSSFLLESAWTFQDRRHRLSPGLYRWYVFPGFGPRAQARYGSALGGSTFVIPPSR